MARRRMDHQELTAIVHRGDLRQEKGDSLGALRDYEEALREAPDDPMIWNNRGVSLSSLGRYDEAIGSYRKAVEIRPGYWMAWYNLGKALHRKADRTPEAADGYEEALAAYERALELNPSHTSTLNNKAVAMRRLRRHEEALEVYDELLGFDPLYGHAWYNKGLLLKLLGFPDEAAKCFEVASGLDPELAGRARLEAGTGRPPARRPRPPRKPAEPPEEGGPGETDLRDVEKPRPKRKEDR